MRGVPGCAARPRCRRTRAPRPPEQCRWRRPLTWLRGHMQCSCLAAWFGCHGLFGCPFRGGGPCRLLANTRTRRPPRGAFGPESSVKPPLGRCCKTHGSLPPRSFPAAFKLCWRGGISIYLLTPLSAGLLPPSAAFQFAPAPAESTCIGTRTPRKLLCCAGTQDPCLDLCPRDGLRKILSPSPPPAPAACEGLPPTSLSLA